MLEKNARRSAVLYWNRPFPPACWRRAEWVVRGGRFPRPCGAVPVVLREAHRAEAEAIDRQVAAETEQIGHCSFPCGVATELLAAGHVQIR